MKQFSAYTAISVICLGIDISLLWLLVSLGLPDTISAAIAYMTGLVIHYRLAVIYVFLSPAATGASPFALYFLSGLAGTIITAGMIHVCEIMGIPLPIGKTLAIMLSFLVVYMVRKFLIFRSDGDAASAPHHDEEGGR